MLGGRLRPCNRVEINGLVFSLEFGASHSGTLETRCPGGFQQGVSDENLIRLGLMLDSRRCVHDISEYVAIFEEAQSGVQADANADLLHFGTSLAVCLERPLHAGRGFHRSNRIVKPCHDRVADRLYNVAAFSLDHWKQDAVVPVDHGHAFEVALLLEVRRGSLDITEQDRHGRAHLFELLVGLSSRVQKFLEFVLIHMRKRFETRDYSKGTSSNPGL